MDLKSLTEHMDLVFCLHWCAKNEVNFNAWALIDDSVWRSKTDNQLKKKNTQVKDKTYLISFPLQTEHKNNLRLAPPAQCISETEG